MSVISHGSRFLGQKVMRKLVYVLLVCAGLAACDPSDRRPGLWLTGEAAEFPTDWSFSNAIPEIAIEVQTPYFVPHSVTIWCADVNGELYVGASAPETKRWPGWVDRDTQVRLRIDGKIYEARLSPLSTDPELAPVQQAFATKYRLQAGAGAPTSSRYWHVTPVNSI